MPLIRDRLKRRRPNPHPPGEVLIYSDGTDHVTIPLGAHVVDGPIDAGWHWPPRRSVPISRSEAEVRERAATIRRLLH